MTHSTSPGGASGLGAALLSQPYLLLVLAPLLWGGNITAGKAAVGNIGPFLLILGRWTGAILLLTIIALPHVRRDWHRIRPALPMLIFAGVCGFALFNLLIYGSSHFTAAVNISIEQAGISVFVLLGNFLVFRVSPKPLQLVGLTLTIVGVVWVATHGDPARILALDVNIGDGMVLLACLLYAIYSLTLRYRPDVHWLSFMFVTAGFAFLTSLVFQAVFGGGFAALVEEVPQVTPLGWVCVIYVATFPSIIAQLCYARGVSLVGPNRASIFINLLPVFGTILSVVVLGEAFEVYHVVASVLVIAGIALAEYAVRAAPVK